MKKVDLSKCPICHNDVSHPIYTEDFDNNYLVECDYCGKLYLHGHGIILKLGITPSQIESNHQPDLTMSIVLRQLYGNTNEQITISSNNYDEIKNSIRILTNPIELLDNLLLFLNKKAKQFSDRINVSWKDLPLLYLKNSLELERLLEYLKDLGYIYNYKRLDNAHDCVLTIKGWERIASLQNERKNSKQVFVAMRFGDKDLDSIYNQAIAPAVIECGYSPFRIDKKEHNDKICDLIISEIKRSAFIIADFTFHRGGVYFEAGYALGLGIPVIWTCREDDFQNLHFDTRQYNHIKWSSPDEFKEQLVNRIKATIQP